MLLLFTDDLAQRGGGAAVSIFKRGNLLAHVPQHNSLDGNSRCGDGVAAEDACKGSKDEAPERTQMVAATTAQAPSLQLRAEPRTVAPFMIKKAIKLIQHVGCSPAGEPSLNGVDADRTMLARMVNLHHPVTQCLARI